MHLNVCWPDPSHASEDIRASQRVSSKPTVDTKCISTCVDQTPFMPECTQNAYQLVLTKPIPCQRAYNMQSNMCWPNPQSHQVHKMHLNMDWRKPSHASEVTKCISTCVYQTHPIITRTQIASQHVLSKPLYFNDNTKCTPTCVEQTLSYQHGRKVHRNMCWSTPLVPARTHNAYQIMMTEPLSYQLRHKMNIKSCWPSCSNSSEHTLCI